MRSSTKKTAPIKSTTERLKIREEANGAILTTNLTDPGEKFKDVPDVCVVFISRFDIFKGNLPLYHVDRVIRETGEKAEPLIQ